MSGPIKATPPPALHGHTVRGVSGELFAALCLELDGSCAGGESAHGVRYLMIGPNVAIYPRFAPPAVPVDVAALFRAERERAEAIKRRGQAIRRWGHRALFVAALPFAWVLIDWLMSTYGAYASAVVRFLR